MCRNQEDCQFNVNPLYAEKPANKTFSKGKDSGGRGKGKSNKSNPNPNTSNNKRQGGRKRGGRKSFGGRGHGRGMNSTEAVEVVVDEGPRHEVQPSGEEEWQ